MPSASTPVKQAQLEFWTRFSERLRSSSFNPRKPAAKNWYYLAAGVDGAKLALTVEFDAARIGCKLILDHAARDGIADVALLIFDHLLVERVEIETEMGFSDLDWGVPTPTRVYRYRSIDVSEQTAWREAFDWLIDTAERFRDSFSRRIAAFDIAGARPPLPAGDDDQRIVAEPNRPPSGRQRPADESGARDEAAAQPVPEAARGSSESSGFTLAYANEDALEELAEKSEIERLGEWSEWVSLEDVREKAPRAPGVYMVREGPDGPVIYVGMAGERSSGGRPQGIRGRLNAYLTGKGVVSGLGEAAMDRALADPHWVRVRLTESEAGQPRRTIDWGREALVRANVHFRWIECSDRDSARVLEQRCQRLLAGAGLWNRRI